MKKTKMIAAIGGIGIIAASVFLVAADHIDAPAVAGTSTDIADFYAFEGDNPNNTVFVATVQGPLMPGTNTDEATFDEDVIIEFNIDNDGDFIEDLVIQAVKREDTMYFFGPNEPVRVLPNVEEGEGYEIANYGYINQVQISSTTETLTSTGDNMTFFAGPRRDAFFFDFNRFNEVASGSAAPEGFLPSETASDFFENLNVLTVVVEVPNSLLGTPPAHVGGTVGIENLPPAYNVWVATKRKQ